MIDDAMKETEDPGACVSWLLSPHPVVFGRYGVLKKENSKWRYYSRSRYRPTPASRRGKGIEGAPQGHSQQELCSVYSVVFALWLPRGVVRAPGWKVRGPHPSTK